MTARGRRLARDSRNDTKISPLRRSRRPLSGDRRDVAGYPNRIDRITFRRLDEEDLPLLHDWLQREHVRHWWRDTSTLEETKAHYGPALRGEEPTDHYVIVVDGRDAGMIETYLCADYPEWEAVVEVGAGVAGVDLLLGEPELIGRGIGPRVLRAFVPGVVFAAADTHACVASVDEQNRRSLRAFEKAGFRHVRDVEEDGRPHRLLRLDRRAGNCFDRIA